MKKNAKVSLSSVKAFEQAVGSAKEYSQKFAKGISDLEEFHAILSEHKALLGDSKEELRGSQERLGVKIKKIESDIAYVSEELNELEEKLSSLHNELAYTPETIIIPSIDGDDIETSNPAYGIIESRITSMELKINQTNNQLSLLNHRLEQANTIDRRMDSKIDTINAVVYSLDEKQSAAKKLVTEVEQIKSLNDRNTSNAIEKLKRIEELISEYMRIKMKYDSLTIPNAGTKPEAHGISGVNINLTINKTTVNNTPIDDNNKALSREEIIKHGIKLDSNGKICLYDYKSFGGNYNSYETRLSKTSSDSNPILGYYEGKRGESRFIPSNRSAEGIVVIEILKGYNLDGIEYRNAEPDFEPCSEAVVKISAMSENRENYCDINGIPQLGNFTQADIECARLWNSIGFDEYNEWSGRDVLEYRKKNKLSWHEKCDTETMVLVRTEINDFFKHSGGCSECRVRDKNNDGGGFDE